MDESHDHESDGYRDGCKACRAAIEAERAESMWGSAPKPTNERPTDGNDR